MTPLGGSANENDAGVRSYLAWWRSEKNSASLFHALAAAERKPRDKALYARIAATEDEHADVWASRVVAEGGRLPPYRPSRRTRALISFALRVDPALVVGASARRERADAAAYERSASEAVVAVAGVERANAELLRSHAQSDLVEYAQKLVLLFRRWVILVVGATLFATSVALGRNVQIEGLFFGVLAGATTGAVVHYLLAKVLVPLPFGRIWCGWACWTAALLDQLPFRQSRGWLPGGAPRWRRASFAASLGLVAALATAGYAGGLYGASGVAWFVCGNVAYWTLGVVLAFRFEDNRAFCKYACPVSVLLRFTSRTSLVKVAGDAEACAACASKPCANLCPMDIRIADYVARGERVLSTECILCQQCVAVCPPNALRLSAGLDVSRIDLLDVEEARRRVPTPHGVRKRGGNAMIRAHRPVRAAVATLIGILLLEGALALAGGVMLVAAPSGRLLRMPAEWLQGTPFTTFLIPGILLAFALGLLPLFAAVALCRAEAVPRLRRVERALGIDTAWLASFAAGMGIMIWIVVQIAMIRMFHPMQPFIFALGAAIVALSLLPSVRREHALPRH